MELDEAVKTEKCFALKSVNCIVFPHQCKFISIDLFPTLAQLNLVQLGHPNLPQTLQAPLMSMQLRCKRLSEEIIDKVRSNEMSIKQRERKY